MHSFLVELFHQDTWWVLIIGFLFPLHYFLGILLSWSLWCQSAADLTSTTGMALCARAGYCVVRRAEAVLWLNREMLTSTRNCCRTYLPGSRCVLNPVTACFSTMSCTARIGGQKQRKRRTAICVRAASSQTWLFPPNIPLRPAMLALSRHLTSPRPAFGKESLPSGTPIWNGKTDVIWWWYDMIYKVLFVQNLNTAHITEMPFSISVSPNAHISFFFNFYTVSSVRHRATDAPPLSIVAPTFVVVCVFEDRTCTDTSI